MKISARDLRITVTDFDGVMMKFDCSRNAKAALEGLKRGEYVISVQRPSDKRSLQQNRYLWELIGQIAMAENGNKAEDIDIYMQLVEASGAKCEYLMGLPETEKRLRKVFRVVKAVDSRTYNGKEMVVYKCCYGSSTFNKKEMALLIDKTIERAERNGIDTDYWRDILNG